MRWPRKHAAERNATTRELYNNNNNNNNKDFILTIEKKAFVARS